MVPVSSAHCVTGSTTSASRAVSESTTSHTARKSSDRSRSSTCAARGAETTGLDPITSSDLTSDPSASSSSYALRPGPGSASGSTPHTSATCRRAAGSVSLR